MKILIYLTFLLFSLGQLGRLSFFGQQVNGYLYELPLVLTLIYLLTKYRLKPIVAGYTKFKEIFWFLGILLVSYSFNFFNFNLFQNAVSFLYFLRLIVYLSYVGYLAYHLNQEKKLRKTLFNGFVLFSILTVISSGVQYFFYPDLRNLWYLGWDPHYNRLFGVFFDTSAASAIFGLLFWFSAFNFLHVLTLIFVLFIVLTFSRSLYFSFFVSIAYYFWLNKNFRIAFLFLIMFLLFFLVVPKQFGQGVGLQRTFSIQSRLEDYRQGINLWLRNPIFGIGYNRLRYVRNATDAIHSGASLSSSFLIILVDGGIFALILFLMSLWRLVRISVFSSLIIFFIAILSLTDNIILHPHVLFLLPLLLLLQSHGKSLR